MNLDPLVQALANSLSSSGINTNTVIGLVTALLLAYVTYRSHQTASDLSKNTDLTNKAIDATDKNTSAINDVHALVKEIHQSTIEKK